MLALSELAYTQMPAKSKSMIQAFQKLTGSSDAPQAGSKMVRRLRGQNVSKKSVFPFASLSSDLAIKLSSLKLIVPRFFRCHLFHKCARGFALS